MVPVIIKLRRGFAGFQLRKTIGRQTPGHRIQARRPSASIKKKVEGDLPFRATVKVVERRRLSRVVQGDGEAGLEVKRQRVYGQLQDE